MYRDMRDKVVQWIFKDPKMTYKRLLENIETIRKLNRLSRWRESGYKSMADSILKGSRRNFKEKG